MKKFVTNILKYLIGFGIAAILIWWSLHNLSGKDLTDIKEALLRARFWLLVPVFAVLLASHWFRALRWKQLITPLGYQPAVVDLVCGLLIGYIANQVIPRAGEIVRCTTVARANKIPPEKIIGTMVAERAFDIVCLLLISLGTFIMEYDYIESYSAEIYHSLRHGLNAGGPARWLILGGLVLFALLCYWLVKKAKTNKLGRFIANIGHGLAEGLQSIKRVDNKPKFLLNTLLIWTCYVLATWLGCFALEETSHLNISTSIAMLVFGTFGIIVSPGGLGAYPIAIQKTLGLYGLDDNIGLATGWILWLAQFIFTIIFGLAAYCLLNYLKRPVHEKHSIHTA
ncbi:lysylphosphatidylglycerol synthase transmembrane domain-containing protein [Deminuibacter soli]|nr:lysylphosphatidylglycerol synthase transmembrane domain-containing protein [Deminuibacter soli]